jgi:hypothetical protein
LQENDRLKISTITRLNVNPTVGNVGPKGPPGEEWSGQEILERDSWERERERERCLNAHQWDSAWSDWLGSYGSCWLEVGAEGGFRLDLRQDHDPGKRKLKGAVRTETYRCHYCQDLLPPLSILHQLFSYWFIYHL